MSTEIEKAQATCSIYTNAIRQNINVVSEISIRDLTLAFFPTEVPNLSPSEQAEYFDLYHEFIKRTECYKLNTKGYKKLEHMVLEAFERIAPYDVIAGKMSRSQWNSRQTATKIASAASESAATVTISPESPPDNLTIIKTESAKASASAQDTQSSSPVKPKQKAAGTSHTSKTHNEERPNSLCKVFGIFFTIVTVVCVIVVHIITTIMYYNVFGSYWSYGMFFLPIAAESFMVLFTLFGVEGTTGYLWWAAFLAISISSSYLMNGAAEQDNKRKKVLMVIGSILLFLISILYIISIILLLVFRDELIALGILVVG